MKLENRLPAEGINASHEHPLKEFVWLIVGSVALLAALVALIGWGAGWIAPRIPYRYEARLVGHFNFAVAPATEAARAAQQELQALADRLAARMQLPEDMRVRVHYSDSGMVNAMATLGGHTVFFRGLLSKLEHEDTLAMVLAHEMAHLKYRHPAQALGRGIGVGIMLSVVSTELGRSAAGNVLNGSGMTTLLVFNREQERAADEQALQVLAAEYGHVAGALELFELFQTLPKQAGQGATSGIEFLQTHPLTENRLALAQTWAQKNGVPVHGPRPVLSPALAALR